MNTRDWVVFGLSFAGACFALGRVMGFAAGTSQCADAEVADKRPLWWRRSLELAKGRKSAADIGDYADEKEVAHE